VSDIEPERQEEFPRRLLADAASHMRASLGGMGLALERLFPPEARDADRQLDANAAILYQSFYRILRTVNNMTAAAALSDNRTLPVENKDIIPVCREVCLKAEDVARMLGLSLHFVCEEKELTVAINDREVQRLLLNLLSNAMKFTPKGGHITVRLEPTEEWVDLTVADTGQGISQELLPTLFDRYRHVGRLDPEAHGLGLGLPICRHIMAGHSGELFAVSAEGQGTVVTARFPIRQSTGASLRTLTVQYDSGLNSTLLELCDAAPSQAFSVRYLD